MVSSSGAVSQAKTIDGTRHLPACAKTLVASVSEMPQHAFRHRVGARRRDHHRVVDAVVEARRPARRSPSCHAARASSRENRASACTCAAPRSRPWRRRRRNARAVADQLEAFGEEVAGAGQHPCPARGMQLLQSCLQASPSGGSWNRTAWLPAFLAGTAREIRTPGRLPDDSVAAAWQRRAGRQ